MTGDLAGFLLARVAEDEAAARACVGPEWQTGLPATIHPDPTTYRTVTRRVGHVCGSIIAADAVHIARHDPARVLAECEAKRRIVESEAAEYILRDDFPSSLAYTVTDGLVTFTWAVSPGGRISLPYDEFVSRFMVPAKPSLTLRLLALPYADHPDYRSEWAP